MNGRQCALVKIKKHCFSARERTRLPPPETARERTREPLRNTARERTSAPSRSEESSGALCDEEGKARVKHKPEGEQSQEGNKENRRWERWPKQGKKKEGK